MRQYLDRTRGGRNARSVTKGSARGDGKEGNKKDRPLPITPQSPLHRASLIGDQVTTGDESGSGEQF